MIASRPARQLVLYVVWVCQLSASRSFSPASGGFDVEVDLEAAWPQVPRRAAELEWARRLGGDRLLEAVARLGQPDEVVESAGHQDKVASPASAFEDLILRNGYLSPAVEAQRASCRHLARWSSHEGQMSSCNNSTFAAIDVASQDQLQFACEPRAAASIVAQGLAERHNDVNVERRRLLTPMSSDLVLHDSVDGSSNTSAHLVLCGCQSDPVLRSFVDWVVDLQNFRGQMNMVVAYRQADCAAPSTSPREVLSGYSVELRIKSGEYKATDDAKGGESSGHIADTQQEEGDVDDLDGGDASHADSLADVQVLGLHLDVIAHRYPGLTDQLIAFRERIEAEGPGDQLKRWELQDIGLKMVQRTFRSRDPLRTLAGAIDSFPSTMATIARQTKVRPKLRKATEKMRTLAGSVAGMRSSMELNSRPLATSELTLFPVLQRLEASFKALAQLEMLKGSLLFNATSQQLGQALTVQRLDWRDPLLRWVYHVKHDAEAEDWPRRLGSLATDERRRDNMESPRHLEMRQPLYSILFVFRALDSESMQLASDLVSTSRPARVALFPHSVPNANKTLEELEVAFANAYAWLLKDGSKADAAAAQSFVKAVAKKQPSSASDVQSAMKKALPKKRQGSDGDWAAVTAADGHRQLRNYTTAKGLASPCLVVNGQVSSAQDIKTLQTALPDLLRSQAAMLKEAVKAKRLTEPKKGKDADQVLETFLLNSVGTTPTFDEVLTPAVSVGTSPSTIGKELGDSFMDETELDDDGEGSGEVVDGSAAVVMLPSEALSRAATFTSPQTDASQPVSRKVVLFISTRQQLLLLSYFASYLAAGEIDFSLSVSIAGLHSSAPECARKVQRCLSGSHEDAGSLSAAAACCSSEDPEACPCQSGSDGGEPSQDDVHLWLALPPAARAASSSWASAVCNGNLIPKVPLHENVPRILLTTQHCPAAVAGVPALATAAAMRVATPASSEAFRSCMEKVPLALRVHLPGSNATAMPTLVRFTGIIDPLSESAGLFVNLARILHSELQAEVCLGFNPMEVLEDYPLKKWTRHVVVSRDATGGPAAIFEHLVTQHTLTVSMVAPPAWLVVADRSQQDLDNLRSVDAVRKAGPSSRPTISATYVLSRLYLEGSATVANSGNAAAGLQMALAPADWPPSTTAEGSGYGCGFADTRVMKSRGFWAMPACPGMLQLQLVAGASNDTFTVEESGASPLEVKSFQPPVLPLQVKVRPGHKEEDLAKKTIGLPRSKRRKAPKAPTAAAVADDALPTIHIFSLASGHLYERLLSIMVHSVRNHTSCPLHFWFVSNFLSPHFKDMVPRLMSSLDQVEFDLVSFKWPSWLRVQTDKQRHIWAYKILFLDVLFGQDVPRIIFLDADLVIRSDVRELWDMDLKGKPYAFTPFCQGTAKAPDGTDVGYKNPDTLGYRYWESGFWASHLFGTGPYHISALFVVDLLEFRRQSVGDQLRSTYNSLTKDPTSLANLDQDLPNFAQHSIPIHSLPQEWLWCESWCSQDTKSQAKAIDLCQNPMTKEPKTDMARRVISEWEGYNLRTLALQSGILEGQTVLSSVPKSSKDEL